MFFWRASDFAFSFLASREHFRHVHNFMLRARAFFRMFCEQFCVRLAVSISHLFALVGVLHRANVAVGECYFCVPNSFA